ncbi:MAG TPA: hypothetical protein VHH36_05525 [Candidatus Thermoplasmatota archaeon]|nr:hypothetical protein [Candidatus Thermoplasmatota archaeon]
MAEEPRKRVRDEEVVATVVQVILEEGTVASQTRLAQLVNKRLPRRAARVTPERVRVLAVKSGLVGLQIRTRAGGPTPDMTTCPVCRARLKRTANRTLTGAATSTGYKCSRCPWWTGRELRVPQHYVFQARVSRGERDAQTSFVARQRRL